MQQQREENSILQEILNKSNIEISTLTEFRTDQEKKMFMLEKKFSDQEDMLKDTNKMLTQLLSLSVKASNSVFSIDADDDRDGGSGGGIGGGGSSMNPNATTDSIVMKSSESDIEVGAIISDEAISDKEAMEMETSLKRRSLKKQFSSMFGLSLSKSKSSKKANETIENLETKNLGDFHGGRSKATGVTSKTDILSATL